MQIWGGRDLPAGNVNVRTVRKNVQFLFQNESWERVISREVKHIILSGDFVRESGTETDSYLNGFVENKCIKNMEKYCLSAASKHAVNDRSENTQIVMLLIRIRLILKNRILI